MPLVISPRLTMRIIEQSAMLDAAMAMPRVSEVGLEAAVRAMEQFSAGLRAQAEARRGIGL